MWNHQIPSLPDACPSSDRFRRGGRKSKFLEAGDNVLYFTAPDAFAAAQQLDWS